MEAAVKPWERYAGKGTVPAQIKPWERYGGQSSQPAESQAEPRSFLQEAGRQAGLAGRAVIQGAAALPGMIANAPAAISNLAFGTHIPDQNAALSQLLSRVGFPEPENSTERVVGGVNEALSGVGLTVKGAQLAEKVARAASPAITSAIRAQQGGQSLAAHLAQGPRPMGASYVTQALQANPVTQGLAAGGGAAGAGVVREGGGGPGAQFTGGVVGSVLAPATVGAIGSVARTTKALIDPFRNAGQRQMVGERMNMAASNRNEAIHNLRNADEILPGSVPTTGEAARDLGLIGLQKSVTARSQGLGEGAPFGDRLQAQNQARLKAMDDVVGSPKLLASMQKARNALGTGMREEAFGRATGLVDTAGAFAKIDEVLKSPIGARGPVKKAMEMARAAIGEEKDPKRLYEVGKDVNEVIMKQLQKDDPSAYLARSSLSEVRKALYSDINKVTPGFEDYIETYAKNSKPINRIEEAQTLTDRTELAPPDTQGNPILSQAKWATRVKYALPELEKSGALSAKQIAGLKKIGEDLDRGAQLNNPHARSTGSDTLRNLTGANVVGALAGGNVESLGAISATILRPLNFIYQIPNRQMERLMQEAMLDTRLGAQLMAEATPRNTFNLGEMLRSKAQSIGIAIPYGAAPRENR